MPFDFSSVQTFFTQLAPGLPEAAWWVPLAALAFLAAAAAVDAFTSTVPDVLIFFGAVLVTGAQGFYASWDFAASHLAIALGASFGIYAVNQLWYRARKQDALGMGDAKWTLLAVSCFGLMSGLIAWGAGAVLAVALLLILGMLGRKTPHLHFAPFLLIGLCAGLAWLRL